MPVTVQSVPLVTTITAWVEESLAPAGYPKPVRTRLALALTGLVADAPATVSGLSRRLHQVGGGTAQEPSLARRLLRTLEDPRLDPAQLLPAIFRQRLPELLAGVVAAHAANEGCGPSHHARFRPVRLVVDETSQEDAVHLLVIGLLYQGLVLPLAVRAWPQNQPLAEGDYTSALSSLLTEVHALLPPVLRDHVRFLADRGFGHPRVMDLANSLDWAWVLRASGQVRIRHPDGTEHALREVVPQPGTVWPGGLLAEAVPADAAAPVAVCKRAGWRRAQVVGVWRPEQTEPWLLLTNLPARVERLAEYAQRWAIERLFLTWKSHGWDLETGRVRDAARVGRLVSLLVLATWWRIACALPLAAEQLAHLTQSPPPHSRRPQQLRLPLAPPTDDRPWPAKRSLFTWGRCVLQDTDCVHETPAYTWSFPAWEAPPWPQQCHAAYHAPT
jgi:hypothetical protein